MCVGGGDSVLSLYSVQHLSLTHIWTAVQLTLCSCETVWNEAAFLFLCLVSAFGSPAWTTAQTTQVYSTSHSVTHTHSFFSLQHAGLIQFVVFMACLLVALEFCKTAVVALVTHVRADVVLKQSSHQFVGGFLKQSHHCLVQRISVLIQPASDVVWHLQWNTHTGNCHSQLIFLHPSTNVTLTLDTFNLTEKLLSLLFDSLYPLISVKLIRSSPRHLLFSWSTYKFANSSWQQIKNQSNFNMSDSYMSWYPPLQHSEPTQSASRICASCLVEAAGSWETSPDGGRIVWF